LAATGSSQLRWSVVEQRLGRLIADYGPPSKTSPAQAAVYDLADRQLQARPGTILPARDHLQWHDREVFQ
jgi:hypothetical protein